MDYRRHGHKEGSNISQEGLGIATALGEACQQLYDYAVGGNESRTWQTLCAFLIGLTRSNIIKLLAPIAKFGDATLFKGWMDRGLADAVRDTGSNIRGIHKILSPEEFETACADALGGVQEVFTAMSHGTNCVGFGHSPIIELAAIGAGMSLDEVPKLAELDGMCFTQQDDGTITVESLQ